MIFGVASLGFFLLGVGVLTSAVLSRNDWKGVEVVSHAPPSDGKVQGASITVDVAGAVVNPSLYHVDADSRIQDALTAAGGLSAEADRNWVSRNINLAQKLSDGVKIFIPSITSPRSSQAQGVEEQESNIDNQVNINAASASELQTLWGVGEVRAQAIVDGRPYGSIDELVTKKVLPKNVVEKNKNKLSL